jgi:hypothetical protein
MHPIAIVALVGPEEHEDGNAELFAFVVPHADLDHDTILEQVANEMNAQEHEAASTLEAQAHAEGDRPPYDELPDAWTVEKIRAEFHVTIEVVTPLSFVLN